MDSMDHAQRSGKVGKKLEPEDLIEHMVGTYFYVRILLAVIGFALPVALWTFSWTAGVSIEPSMSAYYHADLTGALDITSRDVLVGALFAVAGLLAAYRGFGKGEDWLLLGAAIAAVGVAIFPECRENCSAVNLHYASAVLFFVFIALVIFFCSTNTLDREESRLPNRERYRKFYWLMGAVMLIGPAAAVLANWIGRFNEYIFVAEAAAIFAFALYWTGKTIEIKRSHLEENVRRRAIAGGSQR